MFCLSSVLGSQRVLESERSWLGYCVCYRHCYMKKQGAKRSFFSLKPAGKPKDDTKKKDVKWALMKRGRTPDDDPVALEDKCELCFRTWQGGFSWLTWEQLLQETGKDDSVIANGWQVARERFKRDEGPMQGPGVFEMKGYQLELSKTFQVCTEKDLKKETGKQRLAEHVLKGLTPVLLPTQDGDMEQHYVFAHPQGQMKELKVKVLMECKLSSTALATDGQWWQGQAKNMFQETIKKQGGDSGIVHLLPQKTGAKEEEEEGAELDGNYLDEDDAEDAEIVGVAASAKPTTFLENKLASKRSPSGSFMTPPSKCSKTKSDASGSMLEGNDYQSNSDGTMTLFEGCSSASHSL
eukprot:6492309-Amphidinium_carterae.3